ncbi:MAG TPA: hypothetical protein VNK67_11020 [Burkholderiales bacterium]|nr:hypothetical protein [Burkholderiales bacterium]
MNRALVAALAALALAAPGAAWAQVGLSPQGGGLGLKLRGESPAPAVHAAFGADPAPAWRQVRGSADYTLYVYGGTRELARPGLRATETYGGVVYPLGRAWGSSLEAGVVPESPLAPRRYALSGQLHAALAGGGVSVGLKYRHYELAAASPFAAEIGVPGFAPAPSYQLQLSYRYSAAATFGLAYGRDLETFTPLSEIAGNGPRQLTFTGQHWLSPSWALSYDLLAQDPASPWRVQGLRFGVRYRF